MRFLAICLFLSVPALSAGRTDAADILSFTSSPSSWVGQGQTYTNTSPISAYRYGEIGAYTNAVVFSDGTYTVEMVAPFYTAPTVGHYADAVRWPFMDNGAGLSFSGDGRGDNTLTGSFTVYEAVYNLDGSVASFAADFQMFGGGDASEWLNGIIRYNSSVPIPEPHAATLALPTITGLLRRHRPKA